MNVHCIYCGCEFDPRHGWRRIMGWERKASSSARRGGSDVVLRTPYAPETFACDPCVDRQKHGMSPSQGSLI